MLYDKLVNQGTLYFLSTSFLRGLTFDNAIIIVDECQNLNFHELDTITTRLGQDSKISFCGDFSQSDLLKTHERNGLWDFLRIAEEMKEFNCTEFTIAHSKKWVRKKLLNSKNKTRNRDGIMDIVPLRKQLEIDEGIKHEIYLDHLGLYL